MRHGNILIQEHWEPFIRFMDRTTSLMDGTNLEEWLQASRGHEIERIISWFNNDKDFDIGNYIQAYFNNLSAKKVDNCIDCACKFEQVDQSVCDVCGLDFYVLEGLASNERSQALETMQMINANRLALICEKDLWEHILNFLDVTSRRYDQQNEEYSTAETRLKTDIQELQAYLKKHEVEHQQLLQQKEDLKTMIQTIRTHLKQSDSLYKRYTDRKPQHRIDIKSAETKLFAKPLNNTEFPIDLVTAFHRKPPDGGYIDAICYIIIPEKAWRETTSNVWELDIATIVSGKVSGSYYLQFSSMQRSGEHISIEYSTKNAFYFS